MVFKNCSDTVLPIMGEKMGRKVEIELLKIDD